AMLPRLTRVVLLLLITSVVLLTWSALRADDQDELKVGVQPDGRILVPTNQVLKPAGTQVTFPGRPVDLAFADDGKTLVAKSMKELVFIDAAEGKVKQKLVVPLVGGTRPGFSVVGLVVQGDEVLVTDARNHLHIAKRKADGEYEWTAKVEILAPR